MQNTVKDNYTVSGYFFFFLIHASVSGVGLLGFQHLLFESAGNDAWISIILAGLSLHAIIWMIFKMLGHPAKDVVDLHRLLFGKYLGSVFSFVLVGYYFLAVVTVIRGYIEIIQIWLFPNLKNWILALVLIFILHYVISGGFRVLAGFCFFGVICGSILPLLLYFNVTYGHINHVLPIFNHSIEDILQCFKKSGILFMGFESLLLYFPFIKAPEKSAKWAHLGLLYSTCKYFVLVFITLMYFSQGLLKHTFWPTLVMIKIIEFSFIARIEFLFICIWLMVIIPMICLSIWSCTRIIKRVTNLKPAWSLLLILTTLFFTLLALNERTDIDRLGNTVVEIGFYFVYGYIPLLFILYLFRGSTTQTNLRDV